MLQSIAQLILLEVTDSDLNRFKLIDKYFNQLISSETFIIVRFLHCVKGTPKYSPRDILQAKPDYISLLKWYNFWRRHPLAEDFISQQLGFTIEQSYIRKFSETNICNGTKYFIDRSTLLARAIRLKSPQLDRLINLLPVSDKDNYHISMPLREAVKNRQIDVIVKLLDRFKIANYIASELALAAYRQSSEYGLEIKNLFKERAYNIPIYLDPLTDVINAYDRFNMFIFNTDSDLINSLRLAISTALQHGCIIETRDIQLRNLIALEAYMMGKLELAEQYQDESLDKIDIFAALSQYSEGIAIEYYQKHNLAKYEKEEGNYATYYINVKTVSLRLIPLFEHLGIPFELDASVELSITQLRAIFEYCQDDLDLIFDWFDDMLIEDSPNTYDLLRILEEKLTDPAELSRNLSRSISSYGQHNLDLALYIFSKYLTKDEQLKRITELRTWANSFLGFSYNHLIYLMKSIINGIALHLNQPVNL